MAKIATALRGGVRESADVVIDANGLRIFAQEIHECENHIRQSKQQLASIMAERKRVNREVKSAQAEITAIEQRIIERLEQNDENLALKLAQQVSGKESLLERNQKHAKQLEDHEEQLQQTLQLMINKLNNYRSEYRMAKSTGNMQSVQRKLSTHGNNVTSHFGDMQDSLDRIRERQQQFSDEMQAMDQIDANLSGVSTNQTDELKASAQEILDRIKRKRE